MSRMTFRHPTAASVGAGAYQRRRGEVVNPKRITAAEYDAIRARLRKTGRSDVAIEQVAREFNRGVDTVRRLGRHLVKTL